MKTIFITGAGRGLGKALVEYATQMPDAQIWAGCLHPEKANLGAQVRVVSLDVRDDTAIGAAVATIQQHSSQIDVLINNAGIEYPLPEQDLAHVTREQMRNVMEINTFGALSVVQSALPLLKASQHARIINISSQKGSLTWQTTGNFYAYGASKAALNMLTRTLAADLQQDGITTISLHPGWMRTDMGGSDAPFSAQEAAQAVWRIIENLRPMDNGQFFQWDGQIHAW